jgi:hypothetical protein
MSTRFPLAAALAGAAALAALEPRSHAGPTVISDEMLRDTRVTPALGRGYSISTNTFQSICLTGIKRTKPSYNFDYTFDDVDEKMEQKGEKGVSTSFSIRPGWLFRSFLAGYGASGSISGHYTNKVTNKETYNHNILVTLSFDAYYSSVDEAETKLADAPSTLLQRKDVPGFFDACGMYYVRSISRQSALYAVFTYESDTETRDIDFEMSLKASIRNWAIEVSSENSAFNKTTTTTSSHRTTIHMMGFGLGKQDKEPTLNEALVATNLDEFKTAIRAAFKAAQGEDTGMVSAIEVVPWVENPDFQKQLELKPETVPDLDELGFPNKDKDGNPKTKTMLPYEQKRILTENAGFLSEVDRAARAKLNVYYKAKQCRQQINLDYMQVDDQGNWKFISGRDQTVVKNNRQSATMGQDAETMSVGDLYNKELSPERLQLIYMEYDAFMYGGSDASTGITDDKASRERASQAYQLGKYPRDLFPGAIQCVSDLLNTGFTTTSFHQIPTCRRIEEQMVAVSGRVIDDYCMPNPQATAETAQEKMSNQFDKAKQQVPSVGQ